MKILKFLKDQPNLIAIDNHQSINNAKINIKKNHLTFNKGNVFFLFLDNYDKYQDLYLNFSSNLEFSLYIISYNSRKIKINLHFVLEENTKIKLYTNYVSRRKAKITVNRSFDLSENADLHILNSLTYNGDLNLQEVINLNGEAANVNIDLLNIGSETSRFSVSQLANHNAKYTTSTINNWLITEQFAKMNYSVTGSIKKGNEFSNCTQNNKGIMLSDNSEIIVEPKLLIDEYNVSASHGAAIGQMDELQLYYLLSRGLSESEARSLIISGYTNPFINMVDDEGIKQLLIRQISKLIGKANY